MDRQMTKEEVINETISIMNGIRVPVGLLREIGEPLSGCIRNLVIVMQMIDAEKQAMKDRMADDQNHSEEKSSEAKDKEENVHVRHSDTE